MNKKSVCEIRQAFLDFFASKEHVIMSSSSLVPEDDSSLLFTNSGMNQFKNIFLGLELPLNSRIATAQRCVRVGGKHNDLENVGYTNYHLTFFEMLGNFSFGDYFKEDAIHFAWELLTSSKWFNLSKDKLLITVHMNDELSYNIWSNKIGIVGDRIIRVGDKYVNDGCISDNFWQMGDVGPCGPCSEILYDSGETISNVKDKESKYDNNRYVEVWNLVFMEFSRQLDGTLIPLPMLSVDTGMGLERISSILQSVNSSYDIDLFYHLMVGVVGVIGDFDFKDRSLRVITDHIRTCSFLISDGVYPSNIGQGYVLRRIIRRAVRHGKILGIHELFFYKLVKPVITVMGYKNKNLVQNKKNIEAILFTEEKSFSLVLEKGLKILRNELLKLKVCDVLPGERIFHFYSTYGFPLEFTKNICLKHNIKVDEVGFNRAMLIHKKSAQKSSKFLVDVNKLLLMNQHTQFIGYENLSCTSKVIALFKECHLSKSLFKDEAGIVILDKSPFYGESGGQIGDCGELRTDFVCFKVLKTKKYGTVFAHWGKVVSGVLKIGDHIFAQVDVEHRKCVSLNHSATHLLHASLINILGDHIMQRGSFIDNQSLRFDFTHYMPISFDQICLIEDIVNQQIRDNILISCSFLSFQEALNKGAKIVFGKQYSQIVRVLSIGNISIELCAGTHAVRTGDIGLFVIFNEFGVSSGVRRIEAACGMEALFFFHQQKKLLQDIKFQVKNHGSSILKKISVLCSRVNELEKEVEKYKDRKKFQEIERLMNNIRYIYHIKFIIDQVHIVDLKISRMIVHSLKERLKSGIVVIFFITKQSLLHIIVGVTQDLMHYVNAVEIIHYLNSKIGGKGGGHLGLAQSGGGDVTMTSNLIGILNIFLIEKFKFCHL